MANEYTSSSGISSRNRLYAVKAPQWGILITGDFSAVEEALNEADWLRLKGYTCQVCGIADGTMLVSSIPKQPRNCVLAEDWKGN